MMPAAAGLEALISTERVLASVIEAVIGGCYVSFGYDAVADHLRQFIATLPSGRS